MENADRPEVEAERRQGVRVGSGDAVLLRTGYGRVRHETGAAGGFTQAGWHASCLPWLHEREVALIGAYTPQKVAKLCGEVAEEGFLYAPDGSDDVEYDRVDISAYVADLLTIRTGLQWYRPTPEDYAAERAAARGFDDMLGGVGSRRSATDDEKEFGEQ